MRDLVWSEEKTDLGTCHKNRGRCTDREMCVVQVRRVVELYYKRHSEHKMATYVFPSLLVSINE